ncbi:CHAT domain-containing protein [Streptomyces sp. NPDC005728]|uniref:CHAT domain-containing protein n=1 Tax=Streptomyces sp. NPDC005728 TaxID=3157054 RepID=UPI0033D4D87D
MDKSLLDRLWARIRAFEDRGRTRAVLSRSATRDLGQAVRLLEGDDEPGWAAVAWLYWVRYLAAWPDGDPAELDTAVSRFSAIRDRPGVEVPELLVGILDQIDAPVEGAFDDNGSAEILFTLSGLAYERYLDKDKQADLEWAVATARATAVTLSPGQPRRLAALNTWGGWLLELAALPDGTLGQCREARDALAAGLAECPLGLTERPLLLRPYIGALLRIAEADSDDADVIALAHALRDAAAELAVAVSDESLPDAFGQAQAEALWSDLVELSVAIHGRFASAAPERPNNPANGASASIGAAGAEPTERSLVLDSMLACVLPPGDPRRAVALLQLAGSQAVRADLDGDNDGLDRAAALFREVADAAAEPDALGGQQILPLALSQLSTLHLRRWGVHQQRPDLDRAVVLSRQALGLATADDPSIPLYRTSLAAALLDRHETDADAGDLTAAAAVLQSGFDLGQFPEPAVGRGSRTPVPGQDAPTARAHSLLGTVHSRIYDATGDVADLDRAIACHRRATVLAENGPMSHVDGSHDWWGVLATALRLRFERLARVEDIDEAIDAAQTALARTPADSFDRAAHLGTYAAALTRRAEWTGNFTELQQAITVAREAVASKHSTDTARTHLNVVLGTAFELSGDTALIDKAVATAREAVAAAASRPMDTTALGNLGATLTTRYQHLGAKADLDEAVKVLRRAAETAPSTARDLTNHRVNLGHALVLRAELTAPRTTSERDLALSDLAEAVALLRLAGDAPGTPLTARPSVLSNLALALHHRFVLRYAATSPADPDAAATVRTDLDAAIDAWRGALALTGPAHLARRRHQSNLAAALLQRHNLSGEHADLDEAADRACAATSDVPGDHTDAIALHTLAQVLAERHALNRDPADLAAARTAARTAAESAASAVTVRLRGAMLAAELARTAGDTDAALDALAAGVELLPLLAWRGLERTDQERRLADLAHLATDAAATALDLGDADRALALLEQGRTVLWAQLLDLRTDVTLLRERHPVLAARLDAVRAALDHSDSSRTTPSVGRMELAGTWDQLVAEVRGLDGFTTFLRPQPPRAEDAAAAGPVVVINVSRLRCDALILTRHGTDLLPLPVLTAGEVSARTGAFLAAVRDRDPGLAGTITANAVLTDTLAWLWHTVAGPVLDRIGTVDRIWWCPTGPLALLPLHAAGEPGRPGVHDLAVSSYTPTISGLQRARTAAPADAPAERADSRMLIVAPAGIPGVPDLQVAGEIDALTALLPGRCTIREGAAATRDRVRTDLPRHRWAHFACHGIARPTDPSASALLLADEPLTVVDIAGLNLGGSELAYLSACDTASGGTALPDEAIHPAAALHLAGFRHVLATLWTVSDALAAPLAAAVYGALAPSVSPPHTPPALATEDSARALHAAVRALREDGNAHLPILWAPYLHVGP